MLYYIRRLLAFLLLLLKRRDILNMLPVGLTPPTKVHVGWEVFSRPTAIPTATSHGSILSLSPIPVKPSLVMVVYIRRENEGADFCPLPHYKRVSEVQQFLGDAKIV